MEEDILTSLAFSIYYNKGIYALLLGSGISCSSGIPSGWSLVVDLIKKLANITENKEPQDPEEWFRKKYKEEPNYSSILSYIVPTSTERVNLLRPYFEPNDEERLNHLKEPSKAHRAIAKLIKNGYINVVITTNFDRLLEKALDEIGITPQVIRNENDINGAIPLVHAPFTLVKINGDYLDCRFKNTEQELNDYSSNLNDYIKRIINEFGLITCGWSATWDIGLIDIIRGAENRRYRGYFTYIKKCEDSLLDLANYRTGKILKIKDADSFFFELSEKIEALEHIDGNIPLDKEIAIARIKKYIVKPENIILYNDLFEAECNEVCQKIKNKEYSNENLTVELLKKVVNETNNNLGILVSMCITAIRWAKEEQEQQIIDCLKKIANTPKFPTGRSIQKNTFNMNYLPSLELLYVIGIACVYYKKFSLLDKIFRIKKNKGFNTLGEKEYIIENINSCLIDNDLLNQFLERKQKTPLSSKLNENIKLYFCNIEEEEYTYIFCIFEYMLALYYNYIVEASHHYLEDFVPSGEYVWRFMRYNSGLNSFNSFFQQIEIEKDKSNIFKQGMFEGSYQNYNEIKERVDKYIKETRMYF